MFNKTLLLVLFTLLATNLYATNNVQTTKEDQITSPIAQISENRNVIDDGFNTPDNANIPDGVDSDMLEYIPEIDVYLLTVPPKEITPDDIPNSPKPTVSSPFWFKVRLLKAYLTLKTELAKQHLIEHQKAYLIASTLAGLGILTAGSVAYLMHHHNS